MVYVDDMKAGFRNMIMCHLFADSDEELMDFAKRLGLKPAWKHNDHFDISQSKRKLAVEIGAKEITQREMAIMVGKKRGYIFNDKI